jgi:hypothetical protein
VDDIVEKETCGKGLREYCVEEEGHAGYCREGEL